MTLNGMKPKISQTTFKKTPFTLSKKLQKNFCESHHAPYMGHVRGGIKEGLRGGGVRREGCIGGCLMAYYNKMVSYIIKHKKSLLERLNLSSSYFVFRL